MDYPKQAGINAKRSGGSLISHGDGGFDMREALNPKRLTIVMWDHSVIIRHNPGDSWEDYDKTLDEAVERGYNTIRIDPMPGLIDLTRPERYISKSSEPYHPWMGGGNSGGPYGEWLIELMEKLLERNLNYALSAWWMPSFDPPSPQPLGLSTAVDVWLEFLCEWEKRFGFAGCVWVDLVNEYPHFPSECRQWLIDKTGGLDFSPAWNDFVVEDANAALDRMRRERPELRYMLSIHGDPRWIDVPVEMDCLDVHFYADADPRWTARTRFDELVDSRSLFTKTDWRAEFSDRCAKSHDAMKYMYRSRQRAKLAAFAELAERTGAPLTTSESWASWYYIDSPDMDWKWLLEWAEWSVEDAIDFKMWGWTPHNYCQPHFENWRDVEWHRRLTERFLNS